MVGKIITVAQQKGGSGKTTVAANLALAFREAGKTVALVDLDPQGSLGRWFMLRVEDDPSLCEGLDFSTSSAWGISYECRKLADASDFVIIDTPPKADSDLRPALRVADLVVVPVASSHVDLWATESVLDLAAREEKPAAVVLNRARPGTRLGGEVQQAASKLGAAVCETSLGNRVGYAEALGRGRGVMELPKSPAHEEIRALKAELVQRLEAG
ncbi:ParA family partition ATPase [Thalassococcus lentus]|uniref:ParA family protein n=1 Tax=Thalassococcus lentus TaxID=1210524 RepID=A0ABT4XX03_9RHOB|nr:ParA family partition ATPase [Thalassococcus lentus]MDA7426491.1 ParA family protein [Thalassococcus lentus]